VGEGHGYGYWLLYALDFVSLSLGHGIYHFWRFHCMLYYPLAFVVLGTMYSSVWELENIGPALEAGVLVYFLHNVGHNT
jgi:hypothetical protein